jgi:hypothetical protein
MFRKGILFPVQSRFQEISHKLNHAVENIYFLVHIFFFKYIFSFSHFNHIYPLISFSFSALCIRNSISWYCPNHSRGTEGLSNPLHNIRPFPIHYLHITVLLCRHKPHTFENSVIYFLLLYFTNVCAPMSRIVYRAHVDKKAVIQAVLGPHKKVS